MASMTKRIVVIAPYKAPAKIYTLDEYFHINNLTL